MRRVLLLFLLLAEFRSGSSQTNSQDVDALQALMRNWQNEPQSWTGAADPCTSWDGISCSNGRVTGVKLSSMNIEGTLSNAIGQLSALTYLDLSNNPSLGGPLTPSIGNLKQLTTLILLGCSFTGNIPQEIGNLRQLTFLALNSNQFTGSIPPAIGFLTNLFWLDLSTNQLSGQIPVSTNSDPGLDKLVNTKHFHFSENQLTGPMNRSLFSANMSLEHVIFNNNKFTGSIPDSLGLIKTLRTIRLDHNQFNGPVPTSIGNLPNLTELSLASNQLNGAVPDLTNATNLNYVDTSNNDFASSPAPQWLSMLTSLKTIFMDNDGLNGTIPRALFSFPQMQQISLANNDFGGLLDMPITISSQLQVINLTNNQILQISNPSYTNSLILTGNPVCSNNILLCTLQQKDQVPYSTSIGPCGAISCPDEQLAYPSPSQSCACSNPFQGLMIFRAPAFSDVTNPTIFQQLEWTLAQNVSLAPGSVALYGVKFSPGAPLIFTLKFLPVSGTSFNRSEVSRISSTLVNQIYKAPPAFGPYSFIASKYFTSPSDEKSSTRKGVIIGISVAGRKRTFTKIMLIVSTSAAATLIFPCIYFLIWHRKDRRFLLCKKTSNNTEKNYKAMIVSYGSLAPKRYMYQEVMKIMSSCSDQLGRGGYGMVFKGRLHDGRLVAVKFLHDCKGNGDEFVNEVMSIGRTSHVNIVNLFGFCLEGSKRALLYEYMPNGSLDKYIYSENPKEILGWESLYAIAIGIARGLEYLHHSCNTRIVHFDIKPQNILLDKDFCPKIADFGLAKLCHTNESKLSITGARGTIGFIAPEVHSRAFGVVSTKSDVYSYGMMLLEMVGGRRNVKSIVEKSSEKYFPDWIYDHLAQDDGLQACEVIGETGETARKMIVIGLWCIQVLPVYRPTITKVLEMFERRVVDLDMPPKQNFSELLENSAHNMHVQGASSARSEETILVNSEILVPRFQTI